MIVCKEETPEMNSVYRQLSHRRVTPCHETQHNAARLPLCCWLADVRVSLMRGSQRTAGHGRGKSCGGMGLQKACPCALAPVSASESEYVCVSLLLGLFASGTPSCKIIRELHWGSRLTPPLFREAQECLLTAITLSLFRMPSLSLLVFSHFLKNT